MKKLLALALAVVMMMAIALPVFADPADTDPVFETRYGDGNDDSSKDNYLEDAEDSYTKDKVEIKYGVAQAYTATIPEAINFHEFVAESAGNQTKGYVYSLQTATVSDVVLAADEYLNVYLKSETVGIYSAGGDSARVWQLRDVEEHATANGAGQRVDYAVRTDKFLPETISGIANNGAILVCKAASGNMGTTGSSATTQLYFSSKGTAQEGTYIDYLTFTVAVETAAAVVENDAPVVNP